MKVGLKGDKYYRKIQIYRQQEKETVIYTYITILMLKLVDITKRFSVSSFTIIRHFQERHLVGEILTLVLD